MKQARIEGTSWVGTSHFRIRGTNGVFEEVHPFLDAIFHETGRFGNGRGGCYDEGQIRGVITIVMSRDDGHEEVLVNHFPVRPAELMDEFEPGIPTATFDSRGLRIDFETPALHQRERELSPDYPYRAPDGEEG